MIDYREIRADGPVTIGTDQRGRYASQIGIKRQLHEGSVSEATSLATFTASRSGSFKESISLARFAAALIARESAPVSLRSLRSLRKILAAALGKVGEELSSRNLIESVHGDSLGSEARAPENI